MSSKLENLVQKFGEAVKDFKDALIQEKNEFIRDAAILRFKFSYELAWRTMKAYLESEKGVRVHSPRDVIREAFKVGLIGEETDWIRMVETRNMTSHVYNEKMAEGVFETLPKYLVLLKKLAKDLHDVI